MSGSFTIRLGWVGLNSIFWRSWFRYTLTEFFFSSLSVPDISLKMWGIVNTLPAFLISDDNKSYSMGFNLRGLPSNVTWRVLKSTRNPALSKVSLTITCGIAALFRYHRSRCSWSNDGWKPIVLHVLKKSWKRGNFLGFHRLHYDLFHFLYDWTSAPGHW